MPFTGLTPDHRRQFQAEGYTVLREIIPPALVLRLRDVCDVARRIARSERDAQAQRLQPVLRDDLDQKAFLEYAELPELRAAISGVLGGGKGEFRHGKREVFGVLFEPRDQPWATHWHRDWRDNIEYVDRAKWWAAFHDERCFNQINCALYDDDSLWIVPGSHLRGDTPEEMALWPTRPTPPPELTPDMGADARYEKCLELARSMPGARNLVLHPGDFCVYRNTLWHLGVYHPAKVRATLHDGAFTEEFRRWTDDARADFAERQARGLGWSAFLHEQPPPRQTPPRGEQGVVGARL